MALSTVRSISTAIAMLTFSHLAIALDQATSLRLLVPGSDIAQSVTANKSDFKRRIYLRSTATTRLDKLRIQLRFLSGPVDASATATANGHTGEFSIDPVAPKALLAVDVAAELPKPGEYLFAIDVIDQSRQPLILRVTRAPPNLQIGSSDGSAITEISDDVEFRHHLMLQSINDADADDIVIEIHGMNGPNGLSSALTFADGEQTLSIPKVAGKSSHPLVVKAQLQQSGAYEGVIRLVYADNVKNYPITVTKNFIPVSLSVGPVGPARTTMKLIGDTTVELHAFAQETLGRTVTMTEPILINLTNKSKDGMVHAGRYDDAQFLSDKETIGSKTLPVVRFAPGDGKDIKIRVSKVNSPGEYSGKLVLGAVDRKAVEANISFLVRRSGFTAGGIVFLGVVVSLLLRLWAEHLRPRMHNARVALAKLQALQSLQNRLGNLDEDEQTVITALRQGLRQLVDDLTIGTVAVDDNRSEVADDKLEILPIWIQTRRRVLRISNHGGAIMTELDKARKYLLAAAPAAAAKETIVTLLTALPAAITKTLGDSITEMQAQLQLLESELQDKTLHQEWQVKVIKTLNAARKAIDDDQLEDADQLIEAATQAAARLLATDLDSLPLPAGASAAAMARMKRELEFARNAVDGAAALDSYKSALGLYINATARSLIKPLDDAIKLLRKHLSTVIPIERPAVQIEITRLANIKTDLVGVPALIQSGDPATARDHCKNAIAAVDPNQNELLDDATPISSSPKTTGKAAGLPAIPDLIGDRIRVPIPDLGDLEPDQAIKTLDQLGAIGDLLYNAVVILIAVLLGVYVLWSDNAQWGMPRDILIAILWGLGLHGLATNPTTYAGLSKLAGSIK